MKTIAIITLIALPLAGCATAEAFKLDAGRMGKALFTQDAIPSIAEDRSAEQS